MSFLYLDKCSCGSPGLNKETNNVRRTDSLKRKNNTEELKRKNDGGGGGGGEKCFETAMNEYTRPESFQLMTDDQRKATTSTGNVGGSIRQEKEKILNAKNIQLSNQTKTTSQKGGIKATDSSDNDAATLPSSGDGGSKGSRGRKEESCSDYTSLAYDVNYVRVSPPKMTRRPKTTETEKRPNRSEQLSNKAAAESVGGPAGETAPNDRRSKELQPPTDSSKKSTDAEAPRGGDNERDEKKKEVVAQNVAKKKISDDDNDSTTTKPAKLSPRLCQSLMPEKRSSEYITLDDLKTQMTKQEEEEVKGDIAESPSASMREGHDSGDGGDGVTLIQDGDSSILEFTFTVRLENDVIKLMKPEENGGGKESPVVSGSVNIVKSENMSTLKPVITVGLRNVATTADTNSQSKGKLEELSLQSRHLSTVEWTPSKNNNGVILTGSNDNGGGHVLRSLKAGERMRTVGRAVREVDHGRSTTIEGDEVVKTVTWSFDQQSGVIGSQSTICLRQQQDQKQTRQIQLDRGETNSQGQGRDQGQGQDQDLGHTSCLSRIGRKHQTLADFISTNQTKITTVAIVHKPADFDEADGGRTMSPCARERKAGEVAKTLPSTTRSSSGGGGRRRRGMVVDERGASTAADEEPELTHMNWDEVMIEAKALGIPLNRPKQQQVHPPAGRRSSVCSSCFDDDLPCITTLTDPKPSWAGCPNCEAADVARRSRDKEKPPAPTAKKASPFKERFKLQNLFCRKPKEDSGREGKGRDNSATRNSTKHQSNNSHHHQQQQQHHQQQYQHLFHTLPGGKTNRGKIVEDGCCLKCMSNAVGRTMSPPAGGHGHHSSPSRATTTTTARSLSTTVTLKKPGSAHDTTTTMHRVNYRNNQQQQQQSSQVNNSPAAGVGTNQRENFGANQESMTSPKKSKKSNNVDFLKSLEQLKNCGWYWGALGFEEAEVKLSGKPDGAFLVRDSSDDRYILSLSFRSQGTTHHTRIEHYRGMFSFYSQQNVHEADTIVDFIENAKRYSEGGKCLYYLRPKTPSSAPAPVLLLYPVSRFATVPAPLKQLAQAAVLDHFSDIASDISD